jgi:hypothetical protein
MVHSPNQHGPQTKFVWLWFILTIGLGLTAFLLFIRNAGTPVPASWGVVDGLRDGAADWFNSLQQTLLFPVTVGALGALILTRRPGHRIGRLLIALGLLVALGLLTQEWAVYGAYTVKADLPGVRMAAWITNWIWVIIFGLLLLTAALFPDGRFLSRRWGWLIGVSLILFALPLLTGAMIETPMSSAFQIPNPFVTTHPADFYDLVANSGVVFMPIATAAVLISAVVRFRISQGRERQQMKWLLAGVALMATLTLVGLGISFGLRNTLGDIMVNTAIVGPALGVGVALLRHQLYDIDVIIRRTLQYAVLSGLLALTYFGLVIVLQNLLSAVGSQQSEFVTVASTLAIAALFFPLRNRVQDFIDRRFYRKKYDAAKVIAEFAAACRDGTDLEKLTARLVEVVEETMQPESVALWLKPTADRRRTTTSASSGGHKTTEGKP